MSMDKVRAPFAFVPIEERPVFVDEALVGDGGVSGNGASTWRDEGQAPGGIAGKGFDGYQDDPFPDGICGSFELEVEALTPIFVRGNGEKDEFSKGPDGRYTLPGSSLRGMLRNVVEIAAMAKLSRVADRRYGIRDLHNRPLYLDHMAAIRWDASTRKNVPMPLVSAGWLQRDDTDAGRAADDQGGDPDECVATLRPCNFAKVSYEQMLHRGVFPKEGRLGDKMASPDKYRICGRGPRPEVDVLVDVMDRHGASLGGSLRRIGDYGRVRDIIPAQPNVPANAERGVLVMTGQPSRWQPGFKPRGGAGNPKHHDFVFYGTPTGVAPLTVTREVYRGFCEVHSDSGERHGAGLAPNDEWKMWKAEFDAGEPVPVFFLRDSDGKTLRAFGLAMMFRLAYRHGVGDILLSSQRLAYDPGLDLAEAIFGRVASHREQLADQERIVREKEQSDDRAARNLPVFARRRNLAGRVRFGHAQAQGKPQVLAPVQAVLGQPKASYYPTYIAQKATADGKVQGNYKTLHDEDALLAGWKRYRPQAAIASPPVPKGVNLERVGTRFKPLATGTRFVSTVHVHNLRPHELGALVWALDFGGSDGCVHTMGLAKSYGYGQVRLRVRSSQLVRNDAFPASPLDPWPSGEALLEEARRAFVAQMQQHNDGWAESDTIRELLATATPLPAGNSDGRHMLISGGDVQRGNEFVAAKRDLLALPLASGRIRTRYSGVGPRTPHRPARTPVAMVTANERSPSAASEVVVQSPHAEVPPPQPVPAPEPPKGPTAQDYFDAIGTLEASNTADALGQNYGLFLKLPAAAQTEVADRVIAQIQGMPAAKRWRNRPWFQAMWRVRTK